MEDTFKAILERIAKNRKDCGSSKKTWPTQTPTQSIRGTYNLTEEEMERNRAKILAAEAERARCEGCDGTHCKQSTRGVYTIITPMHGKFYSAITLCKYEKARRQQRNLDRLFQSARVPAAYAAETFDSYRVTSDNQNAVAAARWAMQEGNRRGLFIYGPRGTGKTMLVAIIANEKARKGQPVLFSSVPDLLEDIRNSFGLNSTAKTFKAAREAPCLILDDLGAEHITDWVVEQLFCLLNYRYNEKLQTIITTNYGMGQLAERLTIYDKSGKADDTQAQRILSRIYGMCERVYLGGKDWRQVGNAG